MSEKDSIMSSSDRTDLPEAFLERMQRLLKEQYPAFLEGYDQPRRYGLRINTLKITPPVFFDKIKTGFHLSSIPWVQEGFYCLPEDTPSASPYYYAGLYYIQEPSAMMPAAILDVEPGDRVLDLCAAPGGKSTALAAKLKGEGVLVANDVSAPRCKALLKNLEVFGVPNMVVTNTRPEKLAGRFSEYFDRVLVDAPCSGEGMFRKDESAVRAWSEEKTHSCASVQRQIILHAADMLRPGGKLLYSTCTFSPSENEAVIAWLLSKRPEMCLTDIPPVSGAVPAFTASQIEPELTADERVDGMQRYQLEKCARIWPHLAGGEGHFIAMLEKRTEAGNKAGPPIKERSRKKNARRDSREGDRQTIMDFLASAGFFASDKQETGLVGQHLSFENDRVFLPVMEKELLAGIPCLRNGLYVGEIRKGRFIPSQSLAMVLRAETCPAALSWSVEDERIVRYLRGETVSPVGEETVLPGGYCLVCAENWPLGWGKITGCLLKNKYHQGWRMV